jgi:SAM-dependent methyltransferase
LAAAEFLTWLAPREQRSWVDLGCGTGALTAAIVRRAEPRSVLGVDPSAAFVETAADHIRNERVRFEVGDAEHIPAMENTADYVVSALMLNFVPEPNAALAEMRRVSAVGGTVAAYVWDYVEGTQLLRYFWDAAVALDPGAAELDEARRFPGARPESLEQLFSGAGLADVETSAIEVPTVFADFDDYWNPFLGGQGPAPTYCMSLDDDARSTLRERIRATLPTAADGSIPLTARAWAVRGTQP